MDPGRRERCRSDESSAAGAGHPLVEDVAVVGDVLLTGRLSPRSRAWLDDHVVRGAVPLPGEVFLELALWAGRQVGNGLVEELTVENPLLLPEVGSVDLRVRVGAEDGAGRRGLTVHSRADSPSWTRRATGVLSTGEPAGVVPPLEWPPVGADVLDPGRFHDPEVGPVLRGVRAVWRRGDEVFVEVALPEGADAGGFGLHPALLHAALHVVGQVSGAARVPSAWSGVRLRASGAAVVRVRATPVGADAMALVVADGSGVPVATAESVVWRRAPLEPLFGVDWVPVPPPDGGVPTTEWTDLTGDPPPELPEFVVVLCPVRALAHPVSAAHDATRWALGAVRSWLAEERFAAARLAIVTMGAVAVTSDEDVRDLAQSAVWGLVRSAQAENPGRFVLVDLDDEAASLDVLPSALATGEPRVAVRSGLLRVPRPVEVRRSVVPDHGFGAGAVLVTGGTGGLGSVVARHLVADRGVRKLVLASRRGPAAEGAERLRGDLVAQGAEVVLVACDVADRAALRALLAGHPVSAVVHAAGVPDDGLIGVLTPERIVEVLRSKIDAAWHLHDLTRDLELSAFVLFSSAAVFGGAGREGSAAATAFLDALAHHRQAIGLPAVSLTCGVRRRPGGVAGHPDEACARTRVGGGMVPLGMEGVLDLFDAAAATGRAALMSVGLPVAHVPRGVPGGPAPESGGPALPSPRGPVR